MLFISFHGIYFHSISFDLDASLMCGGVFFEYYGMELGFRFSWIRLCVYVRLQAGAVFEL